MNDANQELTFDRLDQVSGGYHKHYPGERVFQTSQVSTERYLPPNKNSDSRSYLMTFF